MQWIWNARFLINKFFFIFWVDGFVYIYVYIYGCYHTHTHTRAPERVYNRKKMMRMNILRKTKIHQIVLQHHHHNHYIVIAENCQKDTHTHTCIEKFTTVVHIYMNVNLCAYTNQLVKALQFSICMKVCAHDQWLPASLVIIIMYICERIIHRIVHICVYRKDAVFVANT